MMALVGIGVVLVVLLSCVLWTKWKALDCSFNQAPLRIVTFDGKQSPYHPSVLYFKHGWQGHNYYLVETPFACTYPVRGANYRDQFECPSIHVSQDGLHWFEIQKNPIDALTSEQLKSLDYFSDPHLVFRDECIECWYRITHRHGDYENHNDVSLLRKISADGRVWSESEELARFSDSHPLGDMLISHSVLYSNEEYKIWYVDSIDGQRDIAFATSTDGITWSKKSICQLSGYLINPWHIDVSCWDGVFWLVIFDRIDLSLWRSDDGLSFTFVKSLLLPSKKIGSFYSKDLYRACLVKVEDSYRLYFSADDTVKTSIGVMEGPSPDKMVLVSIDGKKNLSFKQYIIVGVKIMLRNGIGRVKRVLYLYGKRPLMKIFNR